MDISEAIFSLIALMLDPVLTKKRYFLFLMMTGIIMFLLISHSRMISGEVTSLFCLLSVVSLHAINPMKHNNRNMRSIFLLGLSLVIRMS